MPIAIATTAAVPSAIERRAVAAQPAAQQLARRVAVRADELTGLEAAQIVGELARASGSARSGSRAIARSTIATSSLGASGTIWRSGGGGPVATDASSSSVLSRDERRPPREHVVEDRADRVDVGALVDGLAGRLLRRHVRRRAEHLAGRGLADRSDPRSRGCRPP